MVTALLIAIATIAYAGWMSPAWLRGRAVWLLARAEALEAARVARVEALKYWSQRMERARLTIASGGERS